MVGFINSVLYCFDNFAIDTGDFEEANQIGNRFDRRRKQVSYRVRPRQYAKQLEEHFFGAL